jgi:hypothetical protein
VWLIKVRAPEWRLEIEAEKVRLRMRRVDGGWSKFRRSLRAAFLTAGGTHTLFHSSDRQALIDHILRSTAREGGADLGETSPLGAYVEDLFPLHMRVRLDDLRSDILRPWRPAQSTDAEDRIGLVLDEWYRAPELIDVAAVTAEDDAKQRSCVGGGSGGSGAAGGDSGGGAMARPAPFLFSSALCCCGRLFAWLSPCARSAARIAMRSLPVRIVWTVALLVSKAARSVTRLCISVLSLPLDRIAAYYGETIAFQFAWSQFYTRWLVLPAAVGVGLFCAQLWFGALETPYSPLYSLAMALWSIVFLAAWKRRNAELASRWGVLGFEAEEGLRPGFVGRWVADSRTGEVGRVFSRARRALVYAATIPLTLLCVAVLVFLLVLLFSARDNVLAAFSRRTGVALLRQRILDTPSLAAFANDLPTAPPPVDVLAVVRAAWATGVTGFINAPPRAWAPSPHDGAGAFSPATIAAAAAAGLLSPDGRPVLFSASETNGAATWVPTAIGAVPALDVGAVRAYFASKGDFTWWVAMTAPPVALGIVMPVLDLLFSRFALVMNDAENHATESDYRNARICKVFLFRFTAAFISLFWYAFSPSQSLTQLAVQLAAYLVFAQWWSLLLSTAVPALMRRVRDCAFARRVQSAEDSGLAEGRRGRRLIRHAQADAWREARLPKHDSFDDYASSLIQLGHVTFFAWAFPLAPAVALVFNLFAMRANAFRLLYNTQRPIAVKAGGIGIWYSVLEAMALGAVLVNCAQLALVSNAVDLYLPPHLDARQRLLCIFVVEHAVLALRLVLPAVLPATPKSVRTRIAKDDFALLRLQLRGQTSLHATGGV